MKRNALSLIIFSTHSLTARSVKTSAQVILKEQFTPLESLSKYTEKT